MINNREDINRQLIEDRREIHKYAEIKWTEFYATSMVAERLLSLGYSITLGEKLILKGKQFDYPSKTKIKDHMDRAIKQGANPEIIDSTHGLTGVLGEFDSGLDGPTIALRFDMDALSIEESKSHKHRPYKHGYRSINDSTSHACGHDAHTAIGLAIAEVIAKENHLKRGKIKFIFQPAEEGGGGGISIVKKGHLDDVDFFFTLHMGLQKLNGEPLISGMLGCGVNDFMDIRRINVTINGKPSHAATDPHIGNNALLCACNATLNIHCIAPHKEGELRINVGTLEAGTARNIVSPIASMMLEVRGANQVVADYAENRVKNIINAACDMYNTDYIIEVVGKTSSANSSIEAIRIVEAAAKERNIFSEIIDLVSVGGSDDASEMIKAVQGHGGIGTYIGIGSTFESGFHQTDFDINENDMINAVDLLTCIVNKVSKTR